MSTTKNLLIAALLSTVAAVSFAQTPATAKPTAPAATAAAAAPAPKTTVVKKHHHKHHAKKAMHAKATAPASK